MLHKFKTNTLDTLREEVFIDGERIRCSDYVLRHSAGEIATLDISLSVETDITSECYVRIKNKEQIARLMNESEFEEFCEIWKSIHPPIGSVADLKKIGIEIDLNNFED